MSSSHLDASEEPILDVVPVEPALPSEDRIGSLDLIRGIAILGILPVNMPSYMLPSDGMAPPQLIPRWWGDQAVTAVVLFFFAGKMISQLAILFGAGLALQSDRADAAGRRFAGYYLWRLALLLLIGLAHGLLLWWGDILTFYALVGAGALVLRRLSQRALLWCMAGFLTWYFLILLVMTFATVLMSAQMSDQTPRGNQPGFWTDYFTPASELAIYQQGPWWKMVINRALHIAILMGLLVFWLYWDLLACFLAGICLLRGGVFQDVEAHRPLLWRLVIFGLGVGLPLHLVAVWLSLKNPQDPLAVLCNMAGALPQALAYLALVLLWHHSRAWVALQARFQAVGRMALTNYLMQSVICGLIFYSYGLAQFGKWGHAAGFALTLGIWAVELAWSPVWLRHFAMGPVEWSWRSLADRRLRPFRRRLPA